MLTTYMLRIEHNHTIAFVTTIEPFLDQTTTIYTFRRLQNELALSTFLSQLSQTLYLIIPPGRGLPDSSFVQFTPQHYITHIPPSLS